MGFLGGREGDCHDIKVLQRMTESVFISMLSYSIYNARDSEKITVHFKEE